ncbi:M23 family metallopeptidase [Corynebacterium tapiri]|uniref:M23 family metallopeptidase n=1 Tax=Corynebacterium tapiri TaxID=1448266 RepID=A0A5C4U5H5_9CORY|nr:M23 family metallopeptidase [Corynebacterium tapiri]TNL99293.1 M23 family metallopeptidase [Corynebacterium tapiri]
MKRIISVIALSALLCAYVDPTTGASEPGRVLKPASIPEKNWQRGHRGVDLALDQAGEVLAAGSGTVAFAGVVAGRPSISIDHPDGIRTTYTPVHARVKEGDSVSEGQVIGTLAHGHPGLHWGVLKGKDHYIDPLSLLDVPEIRLKPVDARA